MTSSQPSELTQYRLEAIEETLKSIGDTLRQLTTLEQKHLETRQAIERAFASIEKHELRIHNVELELPTLRLIRNWVISGVIGCTSMIGIAVISLLTK
jgi:hypothetical protein